jgi:ATP phosphoribosyltransferase regulatory subunit HisZ
VTKRADVLDVFKSKDLSDARRYSEPFEESNELLRLFATYSGVDVIECSARMLSTNWIMEARLQSSL